MTTLVYATLLLNKSTKSCQEGHKQISMVQTVESLKGLYGEKNYNKKASLLKTLVKYTQLLTDPV